MKDYKRMTVGEIVADNFNNAGIFDKYGIVERTWRPGGNTLCEKLVWSNGHQ